MLHWGPGGVDEILEIADLRVDLVRHRATRADEMFPSKTDREDVTSYAVHRPDGNWSIMLVNRNESNPHTVHVVFDDARGKHERSFSGPVAYTTFGSEQYVWRDDEAASHADPDAPRAGHAILADPQTTFTLPKASITVLRGHL